MISERQKKVAVWMHGSSGKMGKEILSAIQSQDVFKVVGGNGRTFEGDPFLQGKKVTATLLAGALKKDHVEVIFDFTNQEGSRQLIDAISESGLRNLFVIIGSTGLDDASLKRWRDLADSNKLAVLIAPNTSIGVLVSSKLAAKAAAALFPKGFDIEIVETHHRAKIDAPSGTAKHYVRQILAKLESLKQVFPRTGARQKNEIGMHAVRGGGIFGEHEVRLISDNEEVKISHRAFSRTLFSKGALDLGHWLRAQKPGFYQLEDVKMSDL
jgi:4-hydroxy-tetrahydrodipicolinate reductase